MNNLEIFSSAKTKKSIAIIISIWVTIQLTISLPDSLLNDWMSWRQADTQNIARNFYKSGESIFYPQINWGGKGPGYVENEFQLYTFIISKIFLFTGELELPGQLLSLIFIIITSLFIYKIVLLRFNNENAALFSLTIFLTSNGAVHLSTAIMPDALSVMFYSIGLYTFLKFIEKEENIHLFAFVLFTALAGLVKPLALNLGIIQFFILFLGKKETLKNIKLWFGWLTVVLIVGGYMHFSYNLYLNYGNTFGVIGGEKKFPTLKGLTVLIHYPKLFYMSVVWGLGITGWFSLIYLLIKKKFTNVEWAMLIGNVIAVFIAMRYMVNQGFSPHYYIFMSLFGAYLSGYTFKILKEKYSETKHSLRFIAVVTILILIIFSAHLYHRTHPLGIHFHPTVNALGFKLKELAEPRSLIIVRSIANERERSTWGNRINNFEDPRVFYITDLNGWSIPRDDKGFYRIKKYVDQGAKYYVEPFRNPVDMELENWLQQNSDLIYSDSNGRIYKFR
ncbi:Dolichyl-phosphate-mannose-protein mannosyltransferase [Ignavibacterium album JCM 16511]|uniref:Dolichyl-phosphate-mannose-protein mannosyltransferase n=1 Tax=Ignavibacterium album (strain DSM 19864 / JCM 16511 / NBRC 101810 / Mat9-16) TaxID=945713 RepID=I0AMH8_IGNAJ|nr:glycosyltransferase family 39 protein [Ignavibacterium album]AFH50185.1 Dolichyl-phosphate-mannose-protein mannosyltransferase [Ignavibacterium album JCM 16511]